MGAWSPWSEEEPYLWVVICKNRKFHNHQNLFSGHKIPLGETDAFSPPPTIDLPLTVRCDECGEEHFYDSADVVRFQMPVAADFKPHPLFL